MVSALAFLFIFALAAVPAQASHDPYHWSLPWSRTCSSSQTLGSFGKGYYWQLHLHGSESVYFSYSGRQGKSAYYWGHTSGSGIVDSIKTSNVFGLCLS